jgi:two-component system, CitB family, response regulator
VVYKQTEQVISVLIIEDDERIAEINRRFMEKVAGYQVIGVSMNE